MNDVEDRLDRIEKKLDTLLALMRAGGGAGPRAALRGPDGEASAPPATQSAPTVTDADLDGPWGNPEVRFVPKRWSGADYKGKRFAECEPEFLEMLAETYEWFAQRDDESAAVDKNGNPKSRWSRLDAARARAWAARLRAGGSAGATPVTAVPVRAAGVVSGGQNARRRAAAPSMRAPDEALPPSAMNDDEIPF
jgi:hypothetical protein